MVRPAPLTICFAVKSVFLVGFLAGTFLRKDDFVRTLPSGVLFKAQPVKGEGHCSKQALISIFEALLGRKAF